MLNKKEMASLASVDRAPDSAFTISSTARQPLRVCSLTGCKVSVRVLTPREFRTMPPVKFSLAEILVSDSVTGFSCDRFTTTIFLSLSSLFLSLSLCSSSNREGSFCRPSINVIREYGFIHKREQPVCRWHERQDGYTIIMKIMIISPIS